MHNYEFVSIHFGTLEWAILTDSVTPVGDDGWAWECPIDKQDISRNTV
jgi:hypothetical protein